jgi:hypothetical protein
MALRERCRLQVLIVWLILSFISPNKTHCFSASRRDSYRNAELDYSAVNEYIEAHYGKADYFEPTSPNSEPIYNAREGVLWKGELVVPSLDLNGFELCSMSGAPFPLQKDWAQNSSAEEILEQDYLSSLRGLLKDTLGPKLEKVVFWHPMIRGTDIADRSARTAPPAALVHIDTDVGAYELEDLVNLIQKNSIGGDNDDDVKLIREAIQSGKRFVIVNAWRNIDPSKPVQRSPLALCLPDYQPSHDCFPYKQPETYVWYIFPEMTTSEVLLFKQYDRKADCVSDLWHCALSDIEQRIGANVPHRQSLDLRALCILDEQLPNDLDRYSGQRQRALLSLQESECFCHKQGSKRNGNKALKWG